MSKKSFGQPIGDSASEIYAVDVAAKATPLERITADEDLQVRVDGLDLGVVEQYATILNQGGSLPPVDVFKLDDGTLLLAAGFHRFAAHWDAGKTHIAAYIRRGSRQDAIEHAENDNMAHGLRLTPKDKKNIFIRRLQRGHEWRELSNSEVGRQLGVHHDTISRWRSEYEADTGDVVTTRRTADGRVMDVSGIQEAQRERASRPDPVFEVGMLVTYPKSNGHYIVFESGPVENIEWVDVEWRYIVDGQPFLASDLEFAVTPGVDVADDDEPDVPDSLPVHSADKMDHIVRYFEDADKYWSLEEITHDRTKRLQAKMSIGVRQGYISEQEANNMIIREVSEDVRDTRLRVHTTKGIVETRGGALPRPTDRPSPEQVINRNSYPPRLAPDNPHYGQSQVESKFNEQGYHLGTQIMGDLLDSINNIERHYAILMEINGVRSLHHRGEEDMALVAHRIDQLLAVTDKLQPHLEDLYGKIQKMIETGKPYDE